MLAFTKDASEKSWLFLSFFGLWNGRWRGFFDGVGIFVVFELLDAIEGCNHTPENSPRHDGIHFFNTPFWHSILVMLGMFGFFEKHNYC